MVVIALLTVLTFLPGVFGRFLNWDDDTNFVNLTAYRGLAWQQLSWMFTAFHSGHYTPLTWLTLGVDHALWGMDPRGYHLSSILLHAATASALFFVARRLLRSGFSDTLDDAALRLGAGFAAVVFAVHPLRVESVVWITERRDVLSGLLYVLATLAYLRAVSGTVLPHREARRAWGWYWTGVAVFGGAILAKALVVSLPLVLVMMDVYPLRRLGGRRGWTGPEARSIWLEKVPFLVLAVAGAVVAFLARAPVKNVASIGDFGLVDRAAISTFGLVFYLWKTVLPLGLSPLYEMPVHFDASTPSYLVRALVAVTVAGAAIAGRRRWPAFTAAATAYAVTLGPVIGIVQSGPQITADRYSYLACIGWAVLAGAGFSWCASRRHAVRGARVWQTGLVAAAAIVLALVTLTARQTLVWANSVSLWEHALSIDPTNARAHTGLGLALYEVGQQQEAIRHFEAATRLNPTLVEALMGLGGALGAASRMDEAAEVMTRAASLHRTDPEIPRYLGDVLASIGRWEQSVTAYQQAIRMAPGLPRPRFALAMGLAALGRIDDAVAALEQATQLAAATTPSDPEVHRFAALVHAHHDRALAEAAWRRYLTALGRIPSPDPEQRARMVEALQALDRLERHHAATPITGAR